MPTYMLVIDKGSRSDDPYGLAFLEAETAEAALAIAAAPHMGYVHAGDDVYVADKADVQTFTAQPAVTFASERERP